MQHSVDSEPVHAHGLDHCASIRLETLWRVLRRVAKDDAGLLMAHDLANRPVLRKASKALVQLLHDAELLTMGDARCRSIASLVSADCASSLAHIFQLHVLQDDTIEAD